MLLKDISLLNADFELEEHRYVEIAGAVISNIGNEPPCEYSGEVIDGRNKLLLPAFYNAHAHTPMTLLRGYGENMNLQDWLFKKIFPFEAHLNAEAIYSATLLGLGEMFRSGTVATTDMYMFGDSIARAFLDAGAKVNLSIGTTCFDNGSFYDMKDYSINEGLFQNYHGMGEGRIQIDMSIHAEYTSHPGVVKEVAEYAKEKNCRMQVHVSETKSERNECIERHGKTPVSYFAQLGLFDVPTTAAHCVWVSDEDMEILKEKGVTVAHCPVSNLKLASGVAPIADMVAKGVKVALGTDGASSNNSLSMVDEMRIMALIHKGVALDPLVISPVQALYMATRSGALSQGREDCGLIKKGMKADFILLDLDNPRYSPREHLLNHVVYAAEGGDVYMTVCDGKVVYKDGEYATLDMEKVLWETEKHYKDIKNQVK
ncbi:MAG: amidohydrolase [Bacillota bacterium]|nr:amidohydrolase [Bacillota bacterium]